MKDFFVVYEAIQLYTKRRKPHAFAAHKKARRSGLSQRHHKCRSKCSSSALGANSRSA